MKVKVNMPIDMEAIRQMDEIIDKWRPGSFSGLADPETRKAFSQDRKDLRRVQTLYKKGKWAEALLHAQNMDTLPRDMIPQKIWDDINLTEDFSHD
jgi:hypothetical protein